MAKLTCGAHSVSWNGVEFHPKDGVVEVPDAAVAAFRAHGHKAAVEEPLAVAEPAAKQKAALAAKK